MSPTDRARHRTDSQARGQRADFFELHRANLTSHTNRGVFLLWFRPSLWRHPFKGKGPPRVPRFWLLLWVLVLALVVAQVVMPCIMMSIAPRDLRRQIAPALHDDPDTLVDDMTRYAMAGLDAIGRLQRCPA